MIVNKVICFDWELLSCQVHHREPLLLECGMSSMITSPMSIWTKQLDSQKT